MTITTTIRRATRGLALIAGFTVASCSHDFLDLEPLNGFTADNFWENERQITQAVNSVYADVRGITTGAMWRLGEYRSDNTTFTENLTDRGQAGVWDDDIFVSGISVQGADGMYDGCYSAIKDINLVLANIDKADFDLADGTGEALREQRRAEARFLRGFFYWMLVRNFGDVAIILEPEFDEADLIQLSRRPVAEVYEQVILPDVNFAIKTLPDVYPASDLGRATSGAARMLLAHAHFTRRDYAAALPLLEEVIGSGLYDLESDFADVFDGDNSTSSELIFAAQFDNNSGQGAGYYTSWIPQNSGTTLTGTANIAAFGGQNRPTRSIYEAFEDGDLRRDISIGVYSPRADTFLYATKFIPPPPITGDKNSADFPIFRYADALLMRSEALLETAGGIPDQVFLDINAIRARAGVDLIFPGNPDPNLDIQDEERLRQFLREERRRELAFESHRWYDLVRYGTVVEVMQAHGEELATYQPYLNDFPSAFTQIPELYPIPQNEVLSYGFAQTPGY